MKPIKERKVNAPATTTKGDLIVFDIPTFRKAFTEFSDTSKYPDTMITFWSSFTTGMINPCAWGTMTLMGIQLYTAHELVLASQNARAGQIGGTPGLQGGNTSSKSVGSVSVSYDTQTTSETGAGYYNLTVYGKQFYRLVKMFGAGAIQL
jgi:hypothetical protein